MLMVYEFFQIMVKRKKIWRRVLSNASKSMNFEKHITFLAWKIARDCNIAMQLKLLTHLAVLTKEMSAMNDKKKKRKWEPSIQKKSLKTFIYITKKKIWIYPICFSEQICWQSWKRIFRCLKGTISKLHFCKRGNLSDCDRANYRNDHHSTTRHVIYCSVPWNSKKKANGSTLLQWSRIHFL